ncbi:hypothetical protein FHR82_009184, partial [Actinophytocola algeriensis]|nr:hypothetical protein [Actinophytocola algeriensis]
MGGESVIGQTWVWPPVGEHLLRLDVEC